MNVHLLAFSVIFFWAHTGRAEEIDPDTMAFMTAISMNRGLYYNYQYVTSLNSSNFDSLVKGKNNSWFVEFYSSWCGHCLRFRTTFMRFALDVSGWKDVVKVGAVDCSNELNTPLCRDYEVLSYPTLRFFPPNFADNFYGTPVNKRGIDEIRELIVDNLINQTHVQQIRYHPGSLNALWAGVSPDVRDVVLVVDCLGGLGSQLVLDYWSLKEIRVVTIPCNNSPIFHELSLQSDVSGLYLVQKGKKEVITISSVVTSREQALDSLYNYFSNLGIKAVKPANLLSVKNLSIDISQAIELVRLGSQWRDRLLKKQHTDQVFQVDIEGALRHTLNVELPSHKHINGTALEAAKTYLTTLHKYFPIGENGKNFIACVLSSFKNEEFTTGMAFSNSVSKCEKLNHPVYLDEHGGWLGCQGTLPNFRGFPCSMWTMFHTLTVQACNKGTNDPQEVLKAMVGYIGNFFGCSDCANHFLQMSSTMSNDVLTLDDGVLWLWKAHNKVNKRLHGDQTEDPHFPKVQFPPPTVCPKCQLPNGIFDEKEVLDFLHKMYSNISFMVVRDIVPITTTIAPKELPQDEVQPAHQMKHEIVVDEGHRGETHTLTNKLLWDFTLFDVSLCFVLYVFSMGLVVFVCIKFLKNRRSYRKKPYSDKF